jgi:hypothetical protein
MLNAVHAHVVLWVHKDDVEAASHGIVACVPGKLNKNEHWELEDDADESAADLLKLVLREQIHTCKDFLCLKNKNKKCSKRFPFSCQSERHPKQDASMGGLWTYYRPREEDRNVIPYHAGILLSWRAHMNIQRVTHTDWTRYLLK